MRIFFCELYKLLSKKIFIICLVVALCINAFTLIYSSAENYNDRTKHNNIEYYNSLIKNCNSSKKASEYLKKELDIINERLTENSTDKDALVEKMTLLNDLISQQNYINRYDDFINNMQIRADNQLSFSIFAEPDSFAYNNIQQTPLDFQHLKGVELYAGNNTFAENATQFQITDYLMIVLVALTCILLFYTERENGLYPLVRSTKNGRTSTIVAKLFAVIAVTVVTTILFYLSNILITAIYFGFGDMSRYIQSIGIFMNCSLKISIFEYLILWILGKTLTLCAFSLLFSFCFTAVKTSAKIYGIIVVFLAVEITANLFIEGASAFSFFKYVNIVYFLSNNNLFGEYLNVNIFSNPVNIIMVWTVVVTTLALVGFFGSVTAFTKTSQISKKSSIISAIAEFLQKHYRIRGSVKIYSGEAYKHYKISFAMVILIILVLFAVSNLNDDLSIRFNDASESAYCDYMEDVEGVIDSDTENYLAKEQQYFDDLETERNEIFSDKNLSETEKRNKSSYIDALFRTKGEAFNRILEQKYYVQIKAEEIDEEPAFVNELVCKRLTEDTYREWLYFTILMAVIIFCSSNIFACEYKNSMVNLIRSNRYGKGKLIMIKLFTVMFTSLLSFTLVYLPYFINFISTFGTKIFDIPIAFMSDYNLLTSSVTVGEYIAILCIVHLVVTLTATTVIFMLSMLLKNNIMTMIVTSGIILIPCLVAMELTDVRMVTAFQNNIWQTVVTVIVMVCLILTVISIVSVFVKFSNIKWRKKICQH